MRKLIIPVLGMMVFFMILFSVINANSPSRFPGCQPLIFRDHFDPTQTVAVWQNHNINPLLGFMPTISSDNQNILGIQSQSKQIEINLNSKSLIARQGEEIILKTPVNIGQYVDTPTGEYSLMKKHLAVDLSGGSTLNHTYYYLPNTPFALYFTSNFAILGSYWSKSFGNQSGFGCVELPLSAAEKLYYWADSPQSSSNPGTKITIISD